MKDIIGYALHKVQEGLFPKNAKPLTGFKPTVIEIVTSYDKNAYRTVYTTKISEMLTLKPSNQLIYKKLWMMVRHISHP